MGNYEQEILRCDYRTDTSNIVHDGRNQTSSSVPSDWTLVESQTLTCYHSTIGSGVYPTSTVCEAIRAEVQLNTAVNNAQEDFYTVTLRAYNYNSSTSPGFPTFNYDAYIWFSNPNPGGIATVQSQGGFQFCPQPTVTLSYQDFISISLLIPCQQTNYTPTLGSTTTTLHWNSYTVDGSAVYNFYAEQGADIDIPKGQMWTFNFRYYQTTPVTFCVEATPSGQQPTHANQCHFDIQGSLTVPDGDFSLSGRAVDVNPCNSASGTITATALQQFQGTVHFSDNPPSSFPTSFNPNSVDISGGSSASTGYSFTAPCNATGTYSWPVNGYTTGGTDIQHSITFYVVTGSFTMSTNPSMTVLQGSSSSSTITISSLNAFSDPVSMSASYPYPALTVKFSQGTINVPNGGTAALVMTVSASCSTSVGVYSVTDIGTYSVGGQPVVAGNTSPVSVSVQGSSQCGGGGNGGGGGCNPCPNKPNP